MILEETAIHDMIQEHFAAIYFGLFWFALALYFAWRGKWSATLPPQKDSPITFMDVVTGFAYFLLSQALVLPALVTAYYFLTTGQGVQWETIPKFTKNWLTLGMVLGAYLTLVFFYFVHLTPEKRRAIFGNQVPPWYTQYLFGASTWLFIFPVVIIWSQLSEMIVLILTKQAPTTQLAVDQFKQVLDQPILMVLMSVLIMFLVPIAEEFLFRGLLQSWLIKRFNSVRWGIVFASLIFAFFHFSPSQGISNISLISSLFLLACFLGFLYEKRRSLWASIGLHSVFNTASILMILRGDG